MKINRKLAEAKWVDYPEDDIKFKLRPFPMSNTIFSTDEIVEATWKRFNYSVVDWEGLLDEDDNPLECNNENKRFIFDYYSKIMIWVSTRVVESTVNILEKKT